MSIGRTISFYPFFMIGYCLKNNLSLITQWYKRTFIFLGIVAVGFIVLTTSVLQFQIEFQRAGVLWLRRVAEITTYQIVIFRYMLMTCSLFISALVLIIVEKTPIIKKLSAFGQSTLFIYYIQTFMFAMISLTQIPLEISLSISMLTLPLLTWISKWSGCRYLMNPLCSVAKLK